MRFLQLPSKFEGLIAKINLEAGFVLPPANVKTTLLAVAAGGSCKPKGLASKQSSCARNLEKEKKRTHFI